MEFGDYLIWIISAVVVAAAFIYGAYRERKAKPWVRTIVFIAEFFLSMLIAFLFMVVLPNTISVFVVLQPLMMADMLVTAIEIFTLLITTNAKRRTKLRIYKTIRKICPFVVSGLGFIILVFAYYNMQTIVQKDYSINSSKLHNNYKAAFISDVHYEKAQEPEIFKNALDRISQQDVDFLFVSGDLVDDYTTSEKMKTCVKMLSETKTNKGIYLVNGNHEWQASRFCDKKDQFDTEQFIDTCKEYKINVINDACVDINNDLQIVGRDDSNSPHRLDDESIAKKVSQDRFTIGLDHQPANWYENMDVGLNLVLSGHYHGGQVWPLHFLSDLTGNYTYGHYEYNNNDLIVTGGIAGWQYPIRTEGNCEFVILNLNQEN